MGKNTGKVGEFCQSGKVGTLVHNKLNLHCLDSFTTRKATHFTVGLSDKNLGPGLV